MKRKAHGEELREPLNRLFPQLNSTLRTHSVCGQRDIVPDLAARSEEERQRIQVVSSAMLP